MPGLGPVPTGFGLAMEIGDWTRFTASTIGAFVRLVPSEHSSGQSQGSIIKNANTHVCRLLGEAAWHHAKVYHYPRRRMQDRRSVVITTVD